VRIYVGNLSYDMSQDELRAMFEPYGEVASANIITDRFTGNSKGFGFVEMPSDEDGKKAIKELRGKQVKGRTLNIEEARPSGAGGGERRGPGPRPGGGFGGGGGRPPRGGRF